MHEKTRETIRTAHGFTLLYSVLITGLLLTIGVAIFNIALKEVILSSAARESQFAFYAADSGIECALFHDFQRNAFDPTGPETNIPCDGQNPELLAADGDDGLLNFGTSTFSFSGSYCADVIVGKHQNPRLTLVESRGYNTCDTSNPRRVERAIRATY